MANLHNNQPILGVAEVAPETKIYNGLPVIGLRLTGQDFIDNKLTLGVSVMTGGEALHNDMRVAGVVFIDDARDMFNNSQVIPAVIIE